MLVIGLTGGIGSGKSTVAKLFATFGITIIDTDQLARDLTLPGQPALQKITHHFGQEILQKDGSLNRTRLRQIIFQDKNERLWLETLLHPLIRSAAKECIQKSTSPYCILVVPLLLETSPNLLVNRILVIDTPEALQLNRVKKRDHTSEEKIQAIMKTQVTRAQRLKAADDVITNDKSLDTLPGKVKKLHEFYLTLTSQE